MGVDEEQQGKQGMGRARLRSVLGWRSEVIAVPLPLVETGDVAVDPAGDGEEVIGRGVFEARKALVLVLAHVEQAGTRPVLRSTARSGRGNQCSYPFE